MPAQPVAGQVPGSLKLMFSKQQAEDDINADFSAAFLDAGIPLSKIDCFQGLFRKYTNVAGMSLLFATVTTLPPFPGMIHTGNWARKDTNVKRLLKEHLRAIKGTLDIGDDTEEDNPRMFYVMFDEWTDSQGVATIHVICGRGEKMFLVDEIRMEGRGPKGGVEHQEIANSIADSLTNLGLLTTDVHFFLTDGQSTVAAAGDVLICI